MQLISIVTTLYKSETFLLEFHARLKKVLLKLNIPYEIILVNDGSPDNSLELGLKIRSGDSTVKIVNLSRNFGHHKAILTGLSFALGDLVFLIDCDLEEDPELLLDFYSKWLEDGGIYDVYYGVQKDRSGTPYRRFAGAVFYKLFNFLSDVPINKNICTVRLMSRRYIDSLLKYKDKNVFLAALFERTGFQQKPILIDKGYKGSSSYNFFKKVALMVDAITSFSSKPLTVIMLSGLTISSVSFLYALYLLIRKVFSHSIISGWTSLMVSIWFLSGIIILSLGTIGVYVSKIYNETKDRPLTVVKEIYENRIGEN